MSEDACIAWLMVAIFLVTAVAAVWLWLTVRIINRRETWPKRAVLILTVLVLVGYPLSFGPAYSVLILKRPRWDFRKSELISTMFWSIYEPMRYGWDRPNTERGPVTKAIVWYTDLWD